MIFYLTQALLGILTHGYGKSHASKCFRRAITNLCKFTFVLTVVDGVRVATPNYTPN